MFSRILVKLIDEAIVPAIALLVVRLLSALLVAKYFGLPFSVGSTGFIYQSQQDFLIINSYSTLAMVLVLAVGLIYVLIKSHLFHESHVHPHVAARLHSLKLSSFIQTSFDLYSQGAIWLSYSYLLFIATGVMVYFGLLYSWILWVSIILNIISTYLFIIDVEKEMNIKKSDASNKEETVISWGEDEL